VTAVTNVGLIPLFPRASAIVTDVGAPLSHAAIVARELGIPARSWLWQRNNAPAHWRPRAG
jgi:phosphoenolpyruvate synthase/pyruvate phosphate dikinase